LKHLLIIDSMKFSQPLKNAEDGTNMDSLTKKAIQQIKEKNYGERFLNDLRQRVYLGVGILGKEIGYKIEH
jgi:hypothetical protein